MPDLTLDVPHTLATRWQNLPDEERERRAAVIVDALTALEAGKDVVFIDDKAWDETDFADAREAIAEGLADVEAGRTFAFEDVWETRRAFWKEKGYSLE